MGGGLGFFKKHNPTGCKGALVLHVGHMRVKRAWCKGAVRVPLRLALSRSKRKEGEKNKMKGKKRTERREKKEKWVG